MKKIIILIISFIMTFSHALCGNNKANQSTTDEPSAIITSPSYDKSTDTT